jgi:hypothetical protein
MDRYSQIEVAYTYKIANLAAWAERPDIRAMVNGASKAHQTVGIQLTSNGWEISGR